MIGKAKMMKKEKGKMKSEKVRMSLLLAFSLLLFTSAARAAAGDPVAEGKALGYQLDVSLVTVFGR